MPDDWYVASHIDLGVQPMRWNSRPPIVTSALVDRARLRRAALRYAEYGWPVTPGAALAGDRFACGRPGCPTTGAHPALDRWEAAATTDAARLAGWWRERAHGVLLATGSAFDVLDVPARLGLDVVNLLRLHAATPGGGRSRGPVAVTPTGRWMFLVRPGDPLCPELEACLDVVRHGAGSWIPAPPTRTVEGRVRWQISPMQVMLHLPTSYEVQELLVDYLGRRARRVAVDQRAA